MDSHMFIARTVLNFIPKEFHFLNTATYKIFPPKYSPFISKLLRIFLPANSFPQTDNFRVLRISLCKSLLSWFLNIFVYNIIIFFIKIWQLLFNFYKDNLQIFVINFFVYKYLQHIIIFFLKFEYFKFGEFILKNCGIILLLILVFIYKYLIIFFLFIFAFNFCVFLLIHLVRDHFKVTVRYWINIFFIVVGGTIIFSYQYFLIVFGLFYIFY